MALAKSPVTLSCFSRLGYGPLPGSSPMSLVSESQGPLNIPTSHVLFLSVLFLEGGGDNRTSRAMHCQTLGGVWFCIQAPVQRRDWSTRRHRMLICFPTFDAECPYEHICCVIVSLIDICSVNRLQGVLFVWCKKDFIYFLKIPKPCG